MSWADRCSPFRALDACAQAIQDEVSRAFADDSPPIRVRIGVHTGDALNEADGLHRVFAVNLT
jgi:class 3 adenylate cyclase